MDTLPLLDITLDFTAGQTRSCETRNLSPGADPVLHLLAPTAGSGAVTEMARDDDSAGNLNARFTFKATTAGSYRLIMRASGPAGTGTADLYCDGKVVAPHLPVGGVFKRLESLRAGETLTVVPLPKGPRAHVLYTLDDNQKMLERYESGADESTGRPLPTAAVQIAMIGESFSNPPGALRLVRNDKGIAGHDPDGDGLGTELERQIGTCSTRQEVVGNWNCARSVDARDTDGDGIPDGTELLGATASAPYQLLPRWGADPLHKDVFIEVDFMARSKTDAPVLMNEKEVLRMTAIYADPETDPVLRLAHAKTLNNPDLQAGINLHLDTGLNPTDDEPESVFATYGDWGGHGVVPPICDGNGCKGAEAENVWRSMMNRNRAGLFHYALGYAGDGGQAPVHSIFLNLPMANGETAAHEFGHSMGLQHFGPDHPGADANCKPNYPSIMSYSFLHHSKVQSFSDGLGRAEVNNVALRERGAVAQPLSPAGQHYLDDLQDVYQFLVDKNTGNVDWNRDGVFEPGLVRAYANDNGDGCEFTSTNAMRAPGQTDKAPAIVKLGSMTAIFYTDENTRKIALDYTNDDLSCPGQEGRCGPPLVHRAISETWNDRILAIAAHRIAAGGEKKILLVYRTREGLFETTMTAAFQWSPPAKIPNVVRAADEFSLTGSETNTILAYKNGDGNVAVKVRGTAANSWGADEIASDRTGKPIGPLASDASPAILSATDNRGTNLLLGLFPLNSRGSLRLFSRDEASGKWLAVTWTVHDDTVIGRPAMTWEETPAGAPLPGRLRVFYLKRSSTGDTTVRRGILQAVPNGPAVNIELGLGDFSNVWYYGKGVDAEYEPGDHNVHLVAAVALKNKGTPQPHILEFRPKADGVVDFVQRDWNDWQGLGVDACRDLLKGGAQVNCPPWPF